MRDVNGLFLAAKARSRAVTWRSLMRTGQGQRLVVADGRRHRFVDELLERPDTELGEQGPALGAVGADVAGRKLSLPFELAETGTIGR